MMMMKMMMTTTTTIIIMMMIIIIIIIHAEFEQYDEQTENIVSTCSIMEKENCMKIYDGVCSQIHFNVRKKVLAKPDDEHWYGHVLYQNQ